MLTQKLRIRQGQGDARPRQDHRRLGRHHRRGPARERLRGRLPGHWHRLRDAHQEGHQVHPRSCRREHHPLVACCSRPRRPTHCVHRWCQRLQHAPGPGPERRPGQDPRRCRRCQRHRRCSRPSCCSEGSPGKGRRSKGARRGARRGQQGPSVPQHDQPGASDLGCSAPPPARVLAR